MGSPAPLVKGDKIAICSPAGIIAPCRLYALAAVIKERGYTPVIFPHALGRHGIYSGTEGERASDLRTAFLNPEIKAIWCSRGGYGAVHLMKELDTEEIFAVPKWLIGFSDISALHSLSIKHDVQSIHGPMAKHILENKGADHDSMALWKILEGSQPSYSWQGHKNNKPGCEKAELYGGNLSVLMGLRGTAYDIFAREGIFFLEDINEPLYKIERIVFQLLFSGFFEHCKGLILGEFKNVENEPIYQMFQNRLSSFAFPIAFNCPIGHGMKNAPLIEGAKVEFRVNKQSTFLSFL